MNGRSPILTNSNASPKPPLKASQQIMEYLDNMIFKLDELNRKVEATNGAMISLFKMIQDESEVVEKKEDKIVTE